MGNDIISTIDKELVWISPKMEIDINFDLDGNVSFKYKEDKNND